MKQTKKQTKKEIIKEETLKAHVSGKPLDYSVLQAKLKGNRHKVFNLNGLAVNMNS